MFANNERDGTEGWVVGDSKENTFWFVQCGSVMGRKCFCQHIVNPSYLPFKEMVVITTFVKIVNKFTGAECEGLVVRTNAAESEELDLKE